MLGADVVGGEEAQEWRAGAAASTAGRPLASSRSTMQTTAATIMPASCAASMALMVEAPVVQTSSTIDDARALLAKSFNAAAGAVGLLGLADQKAVEQGRAGMFLRAPGAGRGHIGDDGVGAHGESADGFGVDSVCFQQFENGVAGEAAAFGVQRRGAAIDVVVAGAAGGELELAELEADAGEDGEKLLGVGR